MIISILKTLTNQAIMKATVKLNELINQWLGYLKNTLLVKGRPIRVKRSASGPNESPQIIINSSDHKAVTGGKLKY